MPKQVTSAKQIYFLLILTILIPSIEIHKSCLNFFYSEKG